MNVTTTTQPALQSLRLEQARQLQSSVTGSCLIVEAVIVFIGMLYFANGYVDAALIWFVSTTAMVLLTALYSWLPVWRELDENKYKPYLRGHVLVTCLTGVVWSGFAIYQLDPEVPFSMSMAMTLTLSITLGGLFPSSAYRPSYLGLATFCVLPLAGFWFVMVPGPEKLHAIGLVVYYLFALVVSARTEINMRDVLLARHEKNLSDKLQAHNAAMAKADEDKTRFMLATVHDFSQPLHAQGYFIDALRSKLIDHEQILLLERIAANWKSQSELVEGLADVARLDDTHTKPKLIPAELDKLLADVASEFESEAAGKRINFENRLTPGIVTTDPALLARMIRNLLSNAFKFTDELGSVVLQNYRVGNQWLIKIKDSGVGIAPENQTVIFDEYKQLGNRNRDRKAGVGLGLSIVRRLADMLDIDVQLSSAANEGTIFTLTLGASSQDSSVLVSNIEKPVTFYDKTPVVVVVDDEKDIRDGMSILLKEWGCRVITAASGSQVLKLLSTTKMRPSLFVVDQRLANDEVGLDLIDKLRDTLNLGVSAVLMTGDVEGLDDIERGLDITLLPKPVSPQILNQRIQIALAR